MQEAYLGEKKILAPTIPGSTIWIQIGILQELVPLIVEVP
jgi:hypothetical protein